jgi:hypothetical protein
MVGGAVKEEAATAGVIDRKSGSGIGVRDLELGIGNWELINFPKRH